MEIGVRKMIPTMEMTVQALREMTPSQYKQAAVTIRAIKENRCATDEEFENAMNYVFNNFDKTLRVLAE